MLESLKSFYQSGKTLPEDFRRLYLEGLRREIFKREDDILHSLYSDLGKPAAEAYASEVSFVLSEIKYILKNLHRWMKPQKVKTPLMFWPAKSTVLPSPKGVVLILGPWNYPFQLLMAPFIGALAAGNCAVLKSSRYAPSTSKIMEEIVKNCFEPGHCWFVSGDEEGARKLVEQNWDHIFFTGSTETGRKIMLKAAESLTPVTLELGGKNPCIVFDDADIKISAERIAWGKFFNAGQTCIAPDTVYCSQNIKEKFIEYLRDTVTRFYGVSPEKSPDYGRIVNSQHVKRLASYLENGCGVISGGRYDEESLYFEPTIIDDVSESAAIMKEEIFGPILPVIGFKHTDDLITELGKKPSPLALYIFSRNKKLQKKIMQALTSGSVGINETIKQGASHHLPFGGIGESGTGMYHGKASFDCFTHFKSVLSSGFTGPGFHYPPYGKTVNLLKKAARIFY